MDESERRYTEEEFALILRKAADPTRQPEDRRGPQGGLTLREIMAIAGEVGLDPALVERAARELERPAAGAFSWLLGASARERLEVSVPGTLLPGDFSRVVDAIRLATEQHGELRQELGSLDWHSGTDLFVTVTPGAESTRIVVSANRSGAQAVSWVFPILAAFMATGITGAVVEPSTVAGGLGIALGMLGTGFLTARAIWATTTRRFRARRDAIMAGVRGEVQASSQPR